MPPPVGRDRSDPTGQGQPPQPTNKHDDAAELILPGGQVDRRAVLAAYECEQTDDDTPVSVEFVLARDLNKRLDQYLVDRIPFLSRTSLQRLIKEQSVWVNDRTPKPSTKLRLGDRVVAVLPPPPSSEIPAEDIPLHVLEENDDFVIINKQDDIIVHPARGNLSGTMINGLAFHFQHRTGGGLSSVGDEFARPGVVHRLDRHTTGVMVFAKSDTAHWRLGKQFEKRRTNKRYLALVHGEVEPLIDTIDFPLGRHPTARERYAVRWDDTGKESLTIYRVRERYRGYTLVELELRTGRTHQIRVHLSHIGYPIVGDDIYGGSHLTVRDVLGPAGGPDLPPRQPLMTRQALHATLLGFNHPMTNEPVTYQAPLHADMARLVGVLREHCFIARPTVAGTQIELDQVL